ncbi:peptidoglycan DD-metalloendopeptidase family protein [bacterium]|nr:peptidoglycan DD-metalloendopeptidase family protein [bacterium]
MRLPMKARFYILFLVIVAALSIAQTEKSELEAVRKQIRELEISLREGEKRERSAVEKLEDLEREMGLIKALIGKLEDNIRINNAEIRRTQTLLDQSIARRERLQKAVARRMVAMYKRGRVADWEVLIHLSDFNQALVWMKYQKLILKNDDRNIRKLMKAESEIQERRAALEREKRANTALMQENLQQSQVLESRKKSHEALIAGIRRNIETEREKLRLKKLAESEIQSRIVQAVQERKRAEIRYETAPFETQRGRLAWPVRGRIVSNYGLYKNPELNTVMENLGIDIQAEEKAPVRCVSAGQILSVYWMRGMGNLVLVDHGSGYFTVYGHLDQVNVNSGDQLASGEVLGVLGDAQSLYGPVLHFQVWKESNHQNPATWLAR